MLVGSRPARSSTRRFCSACRTNTFARRRWRSASWTTTAWAATSASGRSCWAQRAARWMEVRRCKQLVPTFTPVSAPTRDFAVSGGPTGADLQCSPSSNRRRCSLRRSANCNQPCPTFTPVRALSRDVTVQTSRGTKRFASVSTPEFRSRLGSIGQQVGLGRDISSFLFNVAEYHQVSQPYNRIPLARPGANPNRRRVPGSGARWAARICKSGPMEVKHWNEMFAKSRQEVIQWHILKDFG